MRNHSSDFFFTKNEEQINLSTPQAEVVWILRFCFGNSGWVSPSETCQVIGQVDLRSRANQLNSGRWSPVIQFEMCRIDTKNSYLWTEDTHFWKNTHHFQYCIHSYTNPGSGAGLRNKSYTAYTFEGIVYWLKSIQFTNLEKSTNATHMRVHTTAPGTVWTWPLVSARGPCGDLEIWLSLPLVAGSWQID